MTVNPILPFLRQPGVMVLDGGLATALEARGYDLDDELWSAGLLLDAPDAIRDVHLAFLAAGADVITTATYQASVSGFRGRGLSEPDAVALLHRAVRLAVETRNEFWNAPGNRRDRLRPLVAASVGPYGAALADGSEYTGNYGITDDALYAFHRDRWQVLASTEADLLACETVPSGAEVRVLLRLLAETPDRWAWLSTSCRDGEHLNDGSRFRDVVAACDAEQGIAAVGVNCTPPGFIASLIAEARQATAKPIVVYPNSGETYDPKRKMWVGSEAEPDWSRAAAEWVDVGASGVGGCCRVGAATIARLRRDLPLIAQRRH